MYHDVRLAGFPWGFVDAGPHPVKEHRLHADTGGAPQVLVDFVAYEPGGCGVGVELTEAGQVDGRVRLPGPLLEGENRAVKEGKEPEVGDGPGGPGGSVAHQAKLYPAGTESRQGFKASGDEAQDLLLQLNEAGGQSGKVAGDTHGLEQVGHGRELPRGNGHLQLAEMGLGLRGAGARGFGQEVVHGLPGLAEDQSVVEVEHYSGRGHEALRKGALNLLQCLI